MIKRDGLTFKIIIENALYRPVEFKDKMGLSFEMRIAKAVSSLWNEEMKQLSLTLRIIIENALSRPVEFKDRMGLSFVMRIANEPSYTVILKIKTN